MTLFRRITRQACLVLTPVALLATLMVGFGPGSLGASSHREAPLISSDPDADGTDFYMFVSPDAPDTVTIIANYIPFSAPRAALTSTPSRRTYSTRSTSTPLATARPM